MTIDELKQVIGNLPAEERRKLLSDLQSGNYQKGDILSQSLSKIDNQKPVQCPYCEGKTIWSRGSHKGVRRLQCRDCKKYFSTTSGTSLHHVHKKDKWQHYIQCMEEKKSLRQTAKEVGISVTTAFKWRHKILSSVHELEPRLFEGIVEADEFYLRFSEKGRKDLDRPPRQRGTDGNKTQEEMKIGVLVTTDRKGHKMVRVTGKGSLKKKDINKALSGKFDKKALLCSDTSNVYKGLAKREGIEHLFVSSMRKPTQKNKAYHIQTANRLHKDLRDHLSVFKGVSTKYLQNYLYWFLALDKKMKENERIKQWIWLSITTATALDHLTKLKNVAI